MKSCDEMVNSLLQRRERYFARQRKKRRAIACTSCACLAVLTSFCVWQSGMFKPDVTLPDSPDPTQNISSTPDISSDAPTDQNTFVVNRIDAIANADIDAKISNFEKLPYDVWQSIKEEFCQFTGMTLEDFNAKIPENFKSTYFHSVSTRGYKDAELKDEYRLHDYVLEYQTPNDGQVTIALCNFEAPVRDCYIVCDNPKESNINGASAIIYDCNGAFMVQMSTETLNYDIETSNVTLEELEELLTAITE